MVTAAISTLALALAIGPQVQLSLQVAMEQAQPETEAHVEEVLETTESRENDEVEPAVTNAAGTIELDAASCAGNADAGGPKVPCGPPGSA